MVVSLEIGKFTIRQILVDTRRAVNILFCDAITQMGIPDSEIRRISYL